MITLEDFIKMSDNEKSDLINKHLENHTAKTFKSGDIGFTWAQADKVLSECGIYKLDGIYRTSEQAMAFLDNKNREQKKKNFTPEQIERLIELVSGDNYETLLKLANKYNYVSSFILRESRDIRIKTGNGKIKTTTFRLYEDILENWQAYCSVNKKEYSAMNLLSTALQEFMENHPISG